jgi:tetratricopeptide (TPR) repeat protein
MLAGAPQRAAELLGQAAEALQDRDETAILATRAGELADALYEQGRHEEAARWTRVASESAGVEDIDAALSWRPTEAKLLARSKRFDEAEQLARETVELAHRTDAIGRQGDALQALAEVLLGSGKANEARDALQTALERYETKGNVVAAERVRDLLAALVIE